VCTGEFFMDFVVVVIVVIFFIHLTFFRVQMFFRDFLMMNFLFFKFLSFLFFHHFCANATELILLCCCGDQFVYLFFNLKVLF